MKHLYFFLAGLLCFLSLQAQWQQQNTGFPDSLYEVQSIWAVDAQTVWLTAAYDGPGDSTIQVFSRSLDGGQLWTAGNLSGLEGYVPTMIFALNADTAFICFHHNSLDGGKIMRTNDGGTSWHHQATALFPASEEAYPNIVYFWNAQDGFAMGDPTLGYFELYTTSNGGALWERVDSNLIPPIIAGEWGYAGEFSVIGDTLLFGTSEGRIFRSTDKGYTWSVINTPLHPSNRCRFVEFWDPLNGIVADRVNNEALMYRTRDGGLNWEVVNATGTAYGRYFEYIPGTDSTFISSADGGSPQGVSISYDAGRNWMSVVNPAFDDYGVLHFPNPLAGWAGQTTEAGGSGGILKYTGNTVGIAEPAKDAFRIFPNPSEGLAHLEISKEWLPCLVEVRDVHGKLVYSEMAQQSPLSIRAVQGYQSGWYLVSLSKGKQVQTKPLVIIP